MTAAHQSALLSRFNFTGSGLVRVQATDSTDQLLKEAGITCPRRFEYYAVEVKRTKMGFLALKNHPDPGEDEPDNVVATITPPTVPPVRPFIEPREPGEGGLANLIEGEVPAHDVGIPRYGSEVIRADKPVIRDLESDIAEFVENEVAKMPQRTRAFEVQIDEVNRLRLVITAERDAALPVPQEPEQWEPVNPSNIHIIAALHALYACGLSAYEIHP